MKKIYLAGPDVFAPDPMEIGRRKKAICAENGLIGIFPMDMIPVDAARPKMEQGLYMYDVMERAMRDCDAIIVNMTPYHGPSADVGSAFEMGFMKALDKPIFAYSNTDALFADRLAEFWGASQVSRRATGERVGPDGMAFEEFGMIDNLMLDASVRRSTGVSVLARVPATEIYASLESFRTCVQAAAAWFAESRRPNR